MTCYCINPSSIFIYMHHEHLFIAINFIVKMRKTDRPLVAEYQFLFRISKEKPTVRALGVECHLKTIHNIPRVT